MSYSQFNQHDGNAYQNAPATESGLARNDHALQTQDPQTSANSTPNSHLQPTQTSLVLSQQEFLARVDLAKSEIRALSSNIHEIAALHQRALSSPDGGSTAQLENILSQTQLKNTQIRDQIKYLEKDALKTQDGSKVVKSRQAKQLKSEFQQTLDDFSKEELSYQQRYKEQIARQYRIVNPDASDAEVEEASRLDWGSEGVFQTVLKGNRSGQASSVLGAVRARHNELQRIEATIAEIADLFADMAQLVAVQDPVIENTEQNAIQTTDHIDKANVQIDAAKKSAARARKLKWYCALVSVLIILAVGLGVGLGLMLTKKSSQTITGAPTR